MGDETRLFTAHEKQSPRHSSDDDKPFPKIPSFGIPDDSEDDEDPPLDQSRKTRKRVDLDSSSSESSDDDIPIPKVLLFSDSKDDEDQSQKKQVDSDSDSTETDSDDDSEDDSDEDEDPIVHTWRTTTEPTIRLKFDSGDSDSEADQSKNIDSKRKYSKGHKDPERDQVGDQVYVVDYRNINIATWIPGTIQNRVGQTMRRVTFNNTVCIIPAISSPENPPVKPPPPKPSRKSTRIINQPPRLVIKPNQKSYH
ncbi:hypothetical protein B9Z55_028517 [Caenorhabditis nigoni]|uniref:Uncharacterized protein n=1 Tax=Caenorhabditis nigoni TaxID=1611254 RepID=A0A2G5SB22_9PELO|nr:hypothetical protein B9Z55_028517 [Caenorhabditis nigoni]